MYTHNTCNTHLCPFLRIFGVRRFEGTHVSLILHMCNMQLVSHGGHPTPVNRCTQSATRWRTQHTGHGRAHCPFRILPGRNVIHQGFSLLGPYGKDWNYCGVPISSSSNAKGGALRTSATDKLEMFT